MEKLLLAVPKGRILQELEPILERVGIIPEEEFFNKKTRLLRFSTNISDLDIVKVRSFDVVTLVASGAVAFGITGSDVIYEFPSQEIYTPVDLQIGVCRMSLAASADFVAHPSPVKPSHVKVVTKYPQITRRYFSAHGIQAECIKLNGAMEIAPQLGLSQRIVDLVSTGDTLRANGLVEIEKIMDVSSYLIVNRTLFKTCGQYVKEMVKTFQKVIYG